MLVAPSRKKIFRKVRKSREHTLLFLGYKPVEVHGEREGTMHGAYGHNMALLPSGYQLLLLPGFWMQGSFFESACSISRGISA
jgi:hypothetical protein